MCEVRAEDQYDETPHDWPACADQGMADKGFLEVWPLADDDNSPECAADPFHRPAGYRLKQHVGAISYGWAVGDELFGEA